MQITEPSLLPFKDAFTASEVDIKGSEAAHRVPEQCLQADTPLQTPNGMRRIGALKAGDTLLTRSDTYEPITQIDDLVFTKRHLQDHPEAAPIRFDPGAIPGMSWDSATLMSPDCAIAWTDDQHDGQRIPASAFYDGGPIRRVFPEEGVHYIRVHFADAHQICVGGIWIELSPDHCAKADYAMRAPNLVNEARIFRPLRA